MLIYIVEDDKDIREIESYALKNSGYEIGAFEKYNEFDKAMGERKPDLIILDIMLPGKDGLEILKEIRYNADFKKIPVIMVTAKSTELDTVKGLDMGADDYITKPFGVMELISRVKALLRRLNPENEDNIIRIRELAIDIEKRIVKSGDENCELTYKEFELIKTLMQNKGRVLSRDRIMELVWGFEYIGETRTVDMHIKTLRQKLKNSGNLIKTIRNVGYKIEE